MRIAAIFLVVLATVSVSGCFKSRLNSCSQSDKDYAGAQELPPLQAPPGLEPPNTRNALKVPPLKTPERVRGKHEPCLDIPPPFSSQKSTAPKTTAPTPTPAPAQAPEGPSPKN